MELDYTEIGRRIARRRRKLKLTQAQVSEKADISEKYMSNIECAKSIPSTEVVMRLAITLNTTPDEFLVGTARFEDQRWRTISERLRGMSDGQLDMIENFITWVAERMGHL